VKYNIKIVQPSQPVILNVLVTKNILQVPAKQHVYQ